MSSTELVYLLIVVFLGNNPLVKLQLLSPIFKKFMHAPHFNYYTVNLRLSLFDSVVLVDCIHHFHIIYFPGIYGFYFLCGWTML